jgi:hypothetical protein
MAAPTFDKNQWYHLYVNGDKDAALIGTVLFDNAGTRGAVFFKTTNLTEDNQRWQIFPVTVNDTTVYTFRGKTAGPSGFLGTAYREKEDTEGKTAPTMLRGDVATDSVYWSLDAWGDGTFAMSNAANGTGYHMDRAESALVRMNPNITAPQNGQRWSFETIDKIDDVKYSSVSVSFQATSHAIGHY